MTTREGKGGWAVGLTPDVSAITLRTLVDDEVVTTLTMPRDSAAALTQQLLAAIETVDKREKKR